MKIGLNGQRILIQNPAGPELYTINLFKALAKIDSENDYLVYLDREPDKDFFEELRSGNPKFNYKVVNCKRMWTQYGLAKELMKNPVDVFFTAVHTIPMIRSNKTIKKTTPLARPEHPRANLRVDSKPAAIGKNKNIEGK